MNEEHRTPQASDAELLVYLDGELPPRRAREIEQSASNRQRLAELAQQERQLKQHLYRSACPDAHQLGEYHLQLLSGPEAERIAAHLEICPYCAQELKQLLAYLDDVASELEYSVLERLKVLVARVSPDLGVGGPLAEPALAGVRGDDTGPLVYRAEDVQVSLEVQDDVNAADHRSVLGLVLGADAQGWGVYLWREDEEIADTTVDELGNFMLSGVEPDTYRLLLHGEQVLIHIPELTVS
ncbi:MAG TPA: hypothetical protein VK879_15770 [Candidatus Sulfomarinibacteraceae bacterium]|nr:hypothetical protein [Candidatus Sulfomarinibacteraceae bacterium]